MKIFIFSILIFLLLVFIIIISTSWLINKNNSDLYSKLVTYKDVNYEGIKNCMLYINKRGLNDSKLFVYQESTDFIFIITMHEANEVKSLSFTFPENSKLIFGKKIAKLINKINYNHAKELFLQDIYPEGGTPMLVIYNIDDVKIMNQIIDLWFQNYEFDKEDSRFTVSYRGEFTLF